MYYKLIWSVLLRVSQFQPGFWPGMHDFKYSINKSTSRKWPLASQSQRGNFRLFTFSRHLTSDIIINEIVHEFSRTSTFSNINNLLYDHRSKKQGSVLQKFNWEIFSCAKLQKFGTNFRAISRKSRFCAKLRENFYEYGRMFGKISHMYFGNISLGIWPNIQAFCSQTIYVNLMTKPIPLPLYRRREPSIICSLNLKTATPGKKTQNSPIALYISEIRMKFRANWRTLFLKRKWFIRKWGYRGQKIKWRAKTLQT